MSEPLQFLIVDDDELIRTVLGIALRRAGHRVEVASEPHAALRLAKESRPDVIVCDVRLAWASGVQLLTEIEARAQAASEHVPAMILITGEERTAWPYPRLSKPFEADELIGLALGLVGSARARAVTR